MLSFHTMSSSADMANAPAIALVALQSQESAELTPLLISQAESIENGIKHHFVLICQNLSSHRLVDTRNKRIVRLQMIEDHWIQHNAAM